MGLLYPIACIEILPGDSFRHEVAALLRTSPLVNPVMHPVHVAVHHWYVPMRLIWENWEDFITGVDLDLIVPTVNAATCTDLSQALGVGINDPSTPAARTVSALPYRAYNRIWNEFYRDQDLSTPAPEVVGDTDSGANYVIKRASWEKDYFTTARPNPQQGDASSIRLDIPGIGVTNQTYASGTAFYTGGTAGEVKDVSSTGTLRAVQDPDNPGFPDIRAELDINQWREAMAFQRIREHRNRFGKRYRDMLAFLGVNSSDSRLQRPEYLGGGRQTISFSEVVSTAATEDAPLGALAGHGIAALRHRPYKRFFEEHGYVISVMCVRPKTVYTDIVPRTFLRRKYEDFWQKEFEVLGDQEITNPEVFYAASNSNVFGYQQRHDDYRRHPSTIAGQFRFSLADWHMARAFSSQPVLNESFVASDPTERIYADPSIDSIQTMIAHRISARRLVSKVARNG